MESLSSIIHSARLEASEERSSVLPPRTIVKPQVTRLRVKDRIQNTLRGNNFRDRIIAAENAVEIIKHTKTVEQSSLSMQSKLSGASQNKPSVLSKARLSHIGMERRQAQDQLSKLSKMELERLITSAEINFHKSTFSVSNI